MGETVYASLDEAGRLPGATRYFVVAILVTRDPVSLRKIIRRVRLKMGKAEARKRRNIPELKWRDAGQRTRERVLETLARADVEVFLFVLDKEGRKVTDTPGNYARIVGELLRLCVPRYGRLALIVDKHFALAWQRSLFDEAIRDLLGVGENLMITHVDSETDPFVQLADFVAGSTYDKYARGTHTNDLFADRIAVELVERWTHLRARQFGTRV